jgi:hypothetical protein
VSTNEAWKYLVRDIKYQMKDIPRPPTIRTAGFSAMVQMCSPRRFRRVKGGKVEGTGERRGAGLSLKGNQFTRNKGKIVRKPGKIQIKLNQ